MTGDEAAAIEEFFQRALAEDVGAGDLTSEALVPESHRARGRFVAKAPGRVCGLGLVSELFQRLDPEAEVQLHVRDGAPVSVGEAVAEWTGRARTVLQLERLALNLVQRMSGIASETARYVEAVRGTRAKIYDTRKTVPGLRWFDKRAILAGGGYNHRFGLFDQVLIKENHLAAMEAVRDGRRPIEQAIERARAHAPPGTVVEVEVVDEGEAGRAVAAGADIVMLDNFDAAQVARVIQSHDDGRVEFEASGGIDLPCVRTYAETGVQRISVGALTHSPRALDLSLLVIVDETASGGDVS